MFYQILLTLSAAIFCIGVFTDLKTREVPDYVNYFYITSAAIIRVIWAIEQKNAKTLILDICVFGAATVFGILMYKFKYWGGGDTKMLMGAAIALGWLPKERLPFFAFFIINFFVLGALWGILGSAFLAIKHKDQFGKKLREQKQNLTKYLTASTVMLATSYFFLNKGLFTFLLAFLPGMSFLAVFLKAVENSCFYKEISPKKLTEGDWVCQKITKGEKIIYDPKKHVCVSKKQIEQIKKLGLGTVKIKEGIPFVPSFLFALVATIAKKEYAMNLILKLMGLDLLFPA